MAITICPEPAGTGSTSPKAQAAALVLQGLNDIQNGFLDQARSCLEQALEAAPDMPDVHFSLGLLEEEAGDSELACHHYKRATQHDPRHAQAQINLGLLLKQAGELGQAERRFRMAIDSGPALPEAHVNLANLLQQTGR
ncbi:MAG: tetratricopeptide repeat protein, partial [Verrucomicrobia bacterium]|nr:tetratricopeptide repeat protein [Verrucomicrobiota bacterium]